jgi:succinate-semialdehyde dehydrogenase/glutarate-semialdehyde dehydrogenase
MRAFREELFGRDESKAHELADQLEVGMVGINTTTKSAPDLPFGGVKGSGVGRELGRFGLGEFANKKFVREVGN